MTIDELKNCGLIDIMKDLPLSVKTNDDVEECLKDILKRYLQIIDDIKDFKYADITKRVVGIILMAITEYKNGLPNKAYEQIYELFDEGVDISSCLIISDIDDCGYPNEYKQLYRARVGESVSKVWDIFHNPFNRSHLLNNDRYSISGFPCLYVSGSVYGCWLEMNKPYAPKFNVSRFEADNKLRILNLAYLPQDIMELQNSGRIVDLEKYIVTWPLICACSITVNQRDRIFKLEYIIPQLILQAVRDLSKIDGIRYFSVKTKYDNTKCNPVFINYVFPASRDSHTKIDDNLYSTKLLRLFKLTPPINQYMFSILNAPGRSSLTFGSTRSFEINLIRNVTPIEIAQSIFVPYCETEFFLFESTLNKVSAEYII